MDWVALIKPLHVTLAALTGAGLLARGLLALRAGAPPRGRLARIAPHVVDTLLLASGLSMAIALGVTPAQPWFGAKMAALLAYIVLGVITLRFARSTGARIAALGAAMTAFAYIVATAVTRDPGLGL